MINLDQDSRFIIIIRYNIYSKNNGPKITVSSKVKANSHNDVHGPGPGNYNLNS
jgi:hypothetical protein